MIPGDWLKPRYGGLKRTCHPGYNYQKGVTVYIVDELVGGVAHHELSADHALEH